MFGCIYLTFWRLHHEYVYITKVIGKLLNSSGFNLMEITSLGMHFKNCVQLHGWMVTHSHHVCVLPFFVAHQGLEIDLAQFWSSNLISLKFHATVRC